MSSKKNSQSKKQQLAPRSKGYFRVAAAGIVIVLSIGTLAGVWSNATGVRRIRGLFVSPPPVPSPSNPSKEYIYAGARLIATEAPGTTMGPPASMEAKTITDPANPPAPRITITWIATSGAHHYEVEKTTNVNTPYGSVNTNVTGTSYTDTGVSSVTAYLYRVRAVDAGGNTSPYSNIDLATAIAFTDDTITTQFTTVKAAHITELRQAIDAVRATVNQGAVNWGSAITQNSTPVLASHIQDLRTNLDAARNILNLPQCGYTENSILALQASFIRKDHIDQLRQCVR